MKLSTILMGKKRYLALLMAVLMAGGLFTLGAGAAGGIPGEYTFNSGGAATYLAPASLEPGQIWTDRSVKDNGDGKFTVTLSALGRKFIDSGENECDPLEPGTQLIITDKYDNTDFDFQWGEGIIADNSLTVDNGAVTWIIGADELNTGDAPNQITYKLELREDVYADKTTYYTHPDADPDFGSATFTPAVGNKFYLDNDKIISKFTLDSKVTNTISWNNAEKFMNGCSLYFNLLTDNQPVLNIPVIIKGNWNFGDPMNPKGAANWTIIPYLRTASAEEEALYPSAVSVVRFTLQQKGSQDIYSVDIFLTNPGKNEDVGNNLLGSGESVTYVWKHNTDTGWTGDGDAYEAILENSGWITLTRTNEKPTGTITAEKKWDGVPDGLQTPVTVDLIKNGVTVNGSSRVLDTGNSWKASWSDLELGAVYSVAEELTGTEDWAASYSAKSVTLTPANDPATITVINSYKTPEPGPGTDDPAPAPSSAPALTLTKEVTNETAPVFIAGTATLNYLIRIENTGDVKIGIASITDVMSGPGTKTYAVATEGVGFDAATNNFTFGGGFTLEPGETFEIAYSVDIDAAGIYTNDAVVTGAGFDTGEPISAAANATASVAARDYPALGNPTAGSPTTPPATYQPSAQPVDEVFLPAEDMPLGELSQSIAPEDDVVIEDMTPPLSEMPQTGLHNYMALWLCGACLSVLAGAGVLYALTREGAVERRRRRGR